MWACICFSIPVFISIHHHHHLSIHLYVPISLSLCIYLSSIYPSIFFFIIYLFLSIYIATHISVSLYIQVSIYLVIYLNICIRKYQINVFYINFQKSHIIISTIITSQKFLFRNYIPLFIIWGWGGTFLSTYLEDRGQFERVGSLFLLCGPQGSHSGHQA